VRHGTAVAAWTLWTFDVLVVTLATVADPAPMQLGDVTGLLFIVVFATTGSLVASRVPRNPAGWLMSLAALCVALGGVTVFVNEHVHDQRALTFAAWLGTWIWMAGIGPAATLLLLLFPDGHLPSPRWRPGAWLTVVALVVLLVALALQPGKIEGTDIVNPLGLPAPKLVDAVLAATAVVLVICTVVCCISLVVRFRGAEAEQRQQLKWLAWSVPIVLTFVVASMLVQSGHHATARQVDIGNALTALGLSVVPIAIACAILRSRLYDIDLVINRTLVYATLTLTLAVVYLSSVLLLRLAIEPLTGRSDLAVAASTLAVAALFRPLRTRIQTVVDRRFYRRRYDAVLTLQSFTGRLRQEIDLESVCAELRAVVADTMHPDSVSLWLRSRP
jgi:hypothetical protein